MIRSTRLAAAAVVMASVLSFSPAASGQEPRAPTRARPAIKVFRAGGTSMAPAQTVQVVPGQPATEPGVRAPRRVAPEEAARSAAMQVLRAPGETRPAGPGGLQAPKPGELQDVTLTSQRPWINEQAYVTYNLPYGVITTTGAVMFAKGYPGSTGVYFNAVQGQSYLVDFVVDSWGPGTYRVKSGDVEQMFQNADGAQHLMVGVQATTSGWISLWLTRFEGSGYYVQEVRVTRVN